MSSRGHEGALRPQAGASGQGTWEQAAGGRSIAVGVPGLPQDPSLAQVLNIDIYGFGTCKCVDKCSVNARSARDEVPRAVSEKGSPWCPGSVGYIHTNVGTNRAAMSIRTGGYKHTNRTCAAPRAWQAAWQKAVHGWPRASIARRMRPRNVPRTRHECYANTQHQQRGEGPTIDMVCHRHTLSTHTVTLSRDAMY